VGTAVAVPVIAWLPVKVPPLVLDAAAVQSVLLAELHWSVTLCPKLMVVADAGCAKLAVAAGVVVPGADAGAV
jgi:hypothetical protein